MANSKQQTSYNVLQHYGGGAGPDNLTFFAWYLFGGETTFEYQSKAYPLNCSDWESDNYFVSSNAAWEEANLFRDVAAVTTVVQVVADCPLQKWKSVRTHGEAPTVEHGMSFETLDLCTVQDRFQQCT
mmetsp:Transcript_56733/g.133572  ORF Transcript_56733/g.133572 Transcript_56733/m.133572 type:complete len:128 (+) Transcript_56733:324-707(+)